MNQNRTVKVLVVDDAVDNQDLIQAILKDEGYQISVASGGKEALAKIEASPPDLVLLDVMMPEMNGFEVTQRICVNPNLPYIPILLITAYDQLSVASGLNAGADDFICKPFDPEELMARVRSLLRLKFSIDDRDKIARQREDFVSRLTHDLRIPLIASDRVLSLLNEGALGELSQPVHQVIGTMARSNQNMLKLVNTLLEVYRYEAGHKPLVLSPLNLRELIHEIMQELAPLASSKDLILETFLREQTQADNSAQDELFIIMGDYLEIYRVITNIVGNAIKFTEQGGVKVYLSCSRSENPDQDWVMIEVEDTGSGISVVEQANLFQSFQPSGNGQSGTGLGLNLSHRIIEAHQGKISVKSVLNQGSLFTICFPAKSETK
ncbi:MAG: hybrid sensor histidine kinase/response regulator [Aphanocapsa sp. GSE-SYN-MK-11-07L]|nr:hybrid sensor histidine kinase/response regulator [Aphanocapsa sp. GSE-SYN-MK-11-07L]